MLHKNFQTKARNVCVFCEPSSELVLHVTDHFILMLDPFALIPGHLLLTSRKHYGCLGEVPISLQEEAILLRELAYSNLQKAFGKAITRYEHGRAGHCLVQDISARSCHHYHEHLIPAHLPLHSLLTPRFKCIPYHVEQELCTLYERYNEYLLVVEPDTEKRFYIAKSKKVEPHLLRTLAAEILGYPERQNWGDYESCELMLQGKEHLGNLVKELQIT